MAVRGGMLFGFVAACLLSVAFGGSFPKFLPIPKSLSTYGEKIVSAYDYLYPEVPEAWYASWPTSMRMSLAGNAILRKFTLHCHTEPLLGKDQLTSIKFCFDGSCTELDKPGSRSQQLKGPTGKVFQVTLTFSPSNGGSVNYEYVGLMNDMSTKFYCSVKNRMSTLVSNTLEIKDVRYRTPKEIWVVENVPASSLPKNGPQTFKCSKNLAAPGPDAPPLRAEWWYCDKPEVLNLVKCTMLSMNTLISAQGDKWPAHVKTNGDLFIPFFSEGAVNTLQNSRLACKIDGERSSSLRTPLTFNNDKAPNEIKELKMIRPVNTEKISIYDSSSMERSLPCNFEMGPGTFSIAWKFKPKNGGPMTSITSMIRNEQGVKLNDEPANSIKLIGPFNDKTSGSYICEVVWTPSSGGRKQVATGTYEVEVQFFPKVSPKMVPLKYVVDGNDGVLKCLFDGPLVTPSLEINGVKVNLKSKQTISDSVKTVNSDFKSVLSTLSVEVTPVNPAPGAVITYTAKKMDYKSAVSCLSSTHNVVCIGTNKVGSVRSNTLLKVVPKPKMTVGKAPSSFNCIECSAAKSHTVRCDVDNELAIKNSGVVFGQYWMLGKHRVDDLLAVPDAPATKYLVINPDRSLTIRKIDDEDFKKQVNDLGNIECVLTLGYPASVTKLRTEVKASCAEEDLFFISSHTDMRKELMTTIKLTNTAPAFKSRKRPNSC